MAGRGIAATFSLLQRQGGQTLLLGPVSLTLTPLAGLFIYRVAAPGSFVMLFG